MRAAVDIGSNSIKVLVADFRNGALVPIVQRSWITRLGKDLGKKTGAALNTDSVFKTHRALNDIAQLLSQYEIELCHVVGTAAMRNCQNPQIISEYSQKVLGQPVRIISGLEEAELSRRGAELAAQQAFPGQDFFFIDVGGASTEVIVSPHKAHSFGTGAVHAHEYLGLDQIPVSDLRWQQAKQRMVELFDPKIIEELKSHMSSSSLAVGIGGSLTNAAKAAHAEAVNSLGFISDLKSLQSFNEKFRCLDLSARQSHDIEAGRADILPAGVLILCHLLECFQKNSCFITWWGLRHGLLAKI